MKIRAKSLLRLAYVFLLIASFAYALSFFVAALIRMNYPYDLEWLEGGIACGVLRLLEGKPLYAAPRSEYFSLNYPPLYYLVVWAFSKICGLHYWVGRLVSILAAICTGLLLWRLTSRYNKLNAIALIVPGLYYASFHYTGDFYDLFRIDSLAYAFALGAFYVAWSWPPLPSALFSAFFLCAAIFTKQAITPFIPFALLFILPKGKRAALTFSLSSLIIITVGVAWLSSASGDWFYELCIRKSSGIGYNLAPVSRYVLRDLIFKTPLIPLGAGCWCIWSILSRRDRGFHKAHCSLWSLPFVGGLLTFILTRSGYVGWVNDSIPMVIFGFAFVGIFWSSVHTYHGRCARVIEWLLCLSAGLQFLLFMYSPLQQIPTTADRKAGDRLMATLRKYRGDILMIYHPFYPVLIGKRPSFHADELFLYYVQGGGNPEAADLPLDLLARIEEKYYSAIVLDYDRGEKNQVTGTELVEIKKLGRLIDEHYYLAERLFDKDDPSFWPRTGWKVRPDFLYLPR